jgi:hypothetical protein
MLKVTFDGVRSAVKRGFIAGAALLACGLPPTARAQLQSGSSGTSSLTTMADSESWRTLTAFGNCYAQRNVPDAFALIGTEPGSQAEAVTFRHLFRRETVTCLGPGTQLSMPIALIRGAIAEGLYQRRVALPESLVLPPLPAGAPIRNLGQAARCYVAGHREQARALIEGTTAGSRRQYEVLGTMVDDFLHCIPESARGLSFDATFLRYRLAEALLRSGAVPGTPEGGH